MSVKLRPSKWWRDSISQWRATGYQSSECMGEKAICFQPKEATRRVTPRAILIGSASAN